MAFKSKTTGTTFGSRQVGLVHHPTRMLVDQFGQPVSSASPLPAVLVGDNLDEVSGAITTIEFDHHEVHEGNAFIVCDVVVLDDTETREFLITTPDTTKWAHMVFGIRGSHDTTAALYRSTTKTGGTPITAVNRNENSATLATTTVAHTPAGAGDGTLICEQRTGTATGPGQSGGGSGGVARGIHEFILRQNTKYLIRLTANADNTVVSTELDWYEHVSL